jgi:hypothetical protein
LRTAKERLEEYYETFLLERRIPDIAALLNGGTPQHVEPRSGCSEAAG